MPVKLNSAGGGSITLDVNPSSTLTYTLTLPSKTDTIATISSPSFSGTTSVVTLNATGAITTSSTAGIGYRTGAGGNIIQQTSKSTAVTLNQPTGQITMNSEALAGGAEVVFALNNSCIGQYDSIVIQSSFASNNQSYQISVLYCSNAIAYLAVKNRTGGSLSEAVTFNFAIIKGAIS